MIQIGKWHQLKVVKKTVQGLYLGNKKEEVLLPQSQIGETAQVGDELNVFVYRDSQDRKIATLNKPKLEIGELASLEVVSINHIGAFLDWGLERDLFLPYKEQVGMIHKGEVHLVGMYVDKSDRLCATMKVYDLLQTDSPYKVNDEVKGIVYAIKEEIGIFIAVDYKYHGLIPSKEIYGKVKVGDHITLRVSRVQSDGKLELSFRKQAYLQIEEDAKKIMEELDKHNGVLRIHDKSSPEEIKAILHISKAAFKRATGRLMKEGVLEIKEDCIKRSW
ncbi:RNA-binding protein [Sporanaerobium hydrogeniformans]|uniref:RNA-binding protein n=1 Tax=Sporanaerobium hydrogeniformans TaxID=3072179 RepID=A0AC61D9T1_9FIRM|nr:S1-like domain-containing RNA-binding protein [Sporanaerobium hydrogeniformans]PHV69975.1 RNA-binding protein [Sporanaerobium hydrogeniformans]